MRKKIKNVLWYNIAANGYYNIHAHKKRTVSAKKHRRLRNLCRTDYYRSFSSTPHSSTSCAQLLGTSKQPTKRIYIIL